MDRAKTESIIRENGYEDFKWISGKDVVVSQWPNFKCMYGCSSYGKKGACPPSVPSVPNAENSSANTNISPLSTFRKRRGQEVLVDGDGCGCAVGFGDEAERQAKLPGDFEDFIDKKSKDRLAFSR